MDLGVRCRPVCTPPGRPPDAGGGGGGGGRQAAEGAPPVRKVEVYLQLHKASNTTNVFTWPRPPARHPPARPTARPAGTPHARRMPGRMTGMSGVARGRMWEASGSSL